MVNPILKGYAYKKQPLVSSLSVFQSAVILIACILGAIGLCLFSSCQMTPARADMIYSDEQIAQAIKKVENSHKYPYGVKSIKTRGNQRLAHKICLQSIRNAKIRYFKASMPGDFISFMGLRYSPPHINPNWVRLVYHFLEKS